MTYTQLDGRMVSWAWSPQQKGKVLSHHTHTTTYMLVFPTSMQGKLGWDWPITGRNLWFFFFNKTFLLEDTTEEDLEEHWFKEGKPQDLSVHVNYGLSRGSNPMPEVSFGVSCAGKGSFMVHQECLKVESPESTGLMDASWRQWRKWILSKEDYQVRSLHWNCRHAYNLLPYHHLNPSWNLKSFLDLF